MMIYVLLMQSFRISSLSILVRKFPKYTTSSLPSHLGPPLLRLGSLLENSLDHLVANTHCLGKSWGEVGLGLFETVAVGLKVAKGDAVGPSLLKTLSVSYFGS